MHTPDEHLHTRRGFYSRLIGTSLAGASVLEVGIATAAHTRALAKTAEANLFRIEKITALARTWVCLHPFISQQSVISNCACAP